MAYKPFSLEDQWIIKTGGRLLGPFSKTEVINGLRSRRFALVDEINSPFGRWKFVKDETQFSEVVKELKSRDENREDTQTMTATQTVTILTGTDSRLDLTPTPHMKDLFPEFKPPTAPAKKANSEIPVYGMQNDAQFRGQIERRQKRNMLALAIVGLLVIGGVTNYFFQGKKKKFRVSESFSELYNEGMMLRSQGLNEEAIDVFRRAKAIKGNDERVDLELGYLKIAVEGQTLVGRRMLEKAISMTDKRDTYISAYTAIGLSYTLEGDLKNAEEVYNKALYLSPRHTIAKHNLAMLHFNQQKFDVSSREFREVQNSSANFSMAILGEAVSAVELSRVSQAMVSLEDLSFRIQSYLNRNFDLKQELLLLNAVSLGHQRKKREALGAIQALLESDWESSSQHVRDIALDRSFTDWKFLKRYCQELSQILDRDELTTVLLAYCSLRAEDSVATQRMLRDLEVQLRNNPYFQFVKALILRSFGQDADAKAVVRQSLSEVSFISALILKAQYCEADLDFQCAERTWMKVIDLDSNALPAYMGLAQVYLKKKDKEKAVDYINRGQVLSKTFIPLWQLKNSL